MDLFNPQIAKYPMVAIARIRIGEQPKEKKQIANANALIIKVRLGRARLSKHASAFREHRIKVAQVTPGHSPFGRAFHKLAELQIIVACL